MLVLKDGVLEMTSKRYSHCPNGLHIDYHPHRIQQTGSSADTPNSVEVPASAIGESYDLGEVMSFDAEGVSSDEFAPHDSLLFITHQTV